MTNIIEIVAIWTSASDKTPHYALGEAWDEVSHEFTDYVALDRAEYVLPYGYDVRRDNLGKLDLYASFDPWPVHLLPHWRDGECHPAFWLSDGSKLIVLDKFEH